MRKTLKQKVREVISARNTLIRMSSGVHYKNAKGQAYLNYLGTDVMLMARNTDRLLPFYLATGRI